MLALLGVPLVVITVLPRFFELAGSVPALPGSTGPLPTPAFRLSDPTPTNVRQRFAPVIEPPPPTLSPPEAPAAPQAPPRPSPTGERVVTGSGEWVHVRTAEGAEGWVTGLVALPTTASAPR